MEETNTYNKGLQPLTVKWKSQRDKYLKQDGVRLDDTFHIHGFMELETISALRFPRKRESTMWSLGLRAVAASSDRRRVKPSKGALHKQKRRLCPHRGRRENSLCGEKRNDLCLAKQSSASAMNQ